jgi:release factor glutamine methyltransferase
VPDTTLGDWIRRAADVLAQRGLESPRPDAERLAAHALGLEWSQLWPRLDRRVDTTTLDGLLERRASLEPLAYITGSTVFYGLEIACSPGALVPRPETETLVDVALELIAGREAPTVADVGTGTGAVALAVATQRLDARVWATDSSADALEVACRNLEGSSVRVGHGDLLGPLPDGLDLIVSNPPYIPDGRTDLLGPDVMREPAEALFAGPTGDEVLLRLVAESPGRLFRDGGLALEVGTPQQAEAIGAALGSWKESGVADDHTGRPRVVWGRGPR